MKNRNYLLMLFGLSLGTCCQALAQCTERPTLTDHARQSFVSAAYGHEAYIPTEFLATQGCQRRMLSALQTLGARVLYSDENVGYVLASVPRQKIFEVLDLDGISFATIARVYKDEDVVPNVDRKVSRLFPIEIPFPRVAKVLPNDGPYFAAQEAGLNELWSKHPQADGRGTLVAVVDEGIDLLHPALQKVLDEGGRLAPKVVDINVVSFPGDNSNWVEFGPPITTTNGAFSAAGRTWTTSVDGTYRFGIYTRTLLMGPQQDSHTKKLPISVGVLWDEVKGLVWVDTDGDGSFKNETGLSDYAKSQDIGFFGTKASEIDNRIPFGVKIDPEKDAVYVAVAAEGHGTLVAGPLAANGLTGGLFDGAAPNAQIVDQVFGLTQLAPVLHALARKDVDVVNRSGGLARFDGGRGDFERAVLERAIRVYDKPVVAYSADTNLFLVNDYVSPEMLRRNRQAPAPYLDVINSFVWFEPEGVVNTILGPSASLVALSRYLPLELQWDDGRRHTFQDDAFNSPAPTGYGIGDNQSPTIPVVSGILADLISEARREHVRYSAARLYQAVMTSARIIPGFPLSVQGHGLVNAAGAWGQLSKMAAADDRSSPILTSFTIVRNEGGIRKEVNGFSEKFSKVGESVARELWITRLGGYSGGRQYRFRLRGDDGTFKLVDHTATLVQGAPTRVRFKVEVHSKWHVSFLQLIDAKANVVMEEVPLSVQAPDVPKVVSPGVEEYEATMAPRRSDREYVYLGPEVQAARFAMRIPYEGPERISGRYMPEFTNPFRDREPEGDPVDALHHIGPMESFETLFPNTKPGSKEVVWENRGFHAEYETPYDPPAPDVPITGTLIVTKYAVEFGKDGQKLNVTNEHAEIEGKTKLYDAKLVSSKQKGEGAHASLEVRRTLHDHLSQWRVAVSSDSLSADAFLLDCTDLKSGCSVAMQGALGKSGATLVIDNPKKGDWRIVIRTRDKTDKAVMYQVREALLTHSAMPIETADAKHASGSTWSVPLPPKQSDAQYVAFHIAGTAGREGTQNEGAKNGVRIALTALDSNAP